MHTPDYQTPMPDWFDTDNPGPAFYDLTFDWKRPPLTLNDRPNRFVKARLTKDMREQAGWRARAARLPQLPRIHVALTWWVRDLRKRDGNENLSPTLKALIDGVVDAGVVADDDQAHVTRGPSLVAYEKGCTPRLVLRISRVDPTTGQAVAA